MPGIVLYDLHETGRIDWDALQACQNNRRNMGIVENPLPNHQQAVQQPVQQNPNQNQNQAQVNTLFSSEELSPQDRGIGGTHQSLNWELQDTKSNGKALFKVQSKNRLNAQLTTSKRQILLVCRQTRRRDHSLRASGLLTWYTGRLLLPSSDHPAAFPPQKPRPIPVPITSILRPPTPSIPVPSIQSTIPIYPTNPPIQSILRPISQPLRASAATRLNPLLLHNLLPANLFNLSPPKLPKPSLTKPILPQSA